MAPGTAGWRHGAQAPQQGPGLLARGPQRKHPTHRLRSGPADAKRRDRACGRDLTLPRGADEVRASIGDFVEVYVNAPLEVCESRDPKGLYRKARAGQLPAFTGIDDPYEPPLQPEVECRTDRETLEECIAKVLAAIDRALQRG